MQGRLEGWDRDVVGVVRGRDDSPRWLGGGRAWQHEWSGVGGSRESWEDSKADSQLGCGQAHGQMRNERPVGLAERADDGTIRPATGKRSVCLVSNNKGVDLGGEAGAEG